MILKILILVLLSFSFNSCVSKKSDSFVHSIFQTNGASAVRLHTDSLKKLLVQYKTILDKQNPNNYSKRYNQEIINEIKNASTHVKIKFKNNLNPTYKEYLNKAFSKKPVKNRNDYLILGIYKLLYWAYTIDRTHTVTTMQYDIKKLQKANKVMQIVQNKVQNEKDLKGNYLFITWQRPWQTALLRDINDDKAIDLYKYKTKELLSEPNMKFKVVSSEMVSTVQDTLRYLGAEVTNFGTQAIKSVFIFL